MQTARLFLTSNALVYYRPIVYTLNLGIYHFWYVCMYESRDNIGCSLPVNSCSSCTYSGETAELFGQGRIFSAWDPR